LSQSEYSEYKGPKHYWVIFNNQGQPVALEFICESCHKLFKTTLENGLLEHPKCFTCTEKEKQQ